MNQIILFFKENYISIAVIVSIIFALLIIISIREWDLNPPKPDSKLVQSVTVETFTIGEEGSNGSAIRTANEEANEETNEETKQLNRNAMDSNLNKEAVKELQGLKLSPVDSFCQSHLGNSAKLEESCGQLTQDACQETSCCLLLEGKCVAGDAKNGPTFSRPSYQ
jgi:hypothetical protein